MLNVNEMILERVRSIIFTDLISGRVIARLTQLEDSSLTVTAEGDDVVDAIGAVITTIYKAKAAQYTASNSLFSLDLAALQLGTEKEVANGENTIAQSAEEMLTVADNKVTLSHEPIEGTVKFVYKLEDGNLAETLTPDVSASEGKFSISGKEITLPTGTTGRVYVEYEYAAKEAVRVSNYAQSFPETVGCKMFVRFRKTCNDNIKYYGTIVSKRAKIDPSSVELALTSTGKHSFTVNFRKDYCDEDGELFSIIVSED